MRDRHAWPDRLPVRLGHPAQLPGQTGGHARRVGRPQELRRPAVRTRPERAVLAIGQGVDPVHGSAVGLLNMLVLRLGLTSDLVQWLGNYDLALWAVTVAVVWASTPFWAMMILAGLQAIPGELYEAAEIDGADVFGRFRHITLPGLANIIIITTLLSTIWTATSINFVYVLTNGGPAGATMTFPMLAYQVGVAGAQRLGMGAAISLGFLPLFFVFIYILN